MQLFWHVTDTGARLVEESWAPWHESVQAQGRGGVHTGFCQAPEGILHKVPRILLAWSMRVLRGACDYMPCLAQDSGSYRSCMVRCTCMGMRRADSIKKETDITLK